MAKIPGSRRIEHIEDAVRPFRLYDARVKKFFAFRCYVHRIAAMRSALWISKWLPVGDTVEVIDVRNGHLHGAYTRRIHGVQFDHESLHHLPKTIKGQSGHLVKIQQIRRPGDDNGQ